MRLQILGTKSKQPAEIVPTGRWGVDFSPDLAEAETISSATIVITDSKDEDVTATLTSGDPAISADGKKVSIAFRAGDDGATYQVTIKATSDDSGLYEADFRIMVQEV